METSFYKKEVSRVKAPFRLSNDPHHRAARCISQMDGRFNNVGVIE